MTAAQLFLAAVSIVVAGWLWFYVVRPILEDFGIISVNNSADDGYEETPERTSSRAQFDWVEPVRIAETHQAEPHEPRSNEPPADPLAISHKMTRKELTILLAAQKDDEGAYRFSANKIAEFVGGTSAETKGWVAEVRGRKEPASNTLRRPANGW